MLQRGGRGIQDGKEGRMRGQQLIRSDFIVHAIASGKSLCELQDS